MKRTRMKATRKHDPAEAPARRTVYARSGGYCEIRIPGVCVGRGEHWHHRLNRSTGGLWSGSNGLHACHRCHAAVTDRRPEHVTAGWCVQPWRVPAEVPVYLSGRAWVLLDDDGGVTATTTPIETEAA